MSTTIKSWIQFYLRFLLGILTVATIVWLTDVNPDDIWQTINRVDVYPLLAILVPIMLLDRIFMSYKWNLLLRAVGIDISLWDNFRLYMTSSFVGLALPSTVGADLVRSYGLYRKKFDPANVLVSVAIERVLGFFAVAIISLVSAPFLVWRFPDLRNIVIPLAIGTLVISIIFLLISSPRVLRKISGLLSRLGPSRLNSIIVRLHESFHAYRSRRKLLGIFLGLSLLETTLPIAISALLAEFLGIELPWITYVLIIPFTLLLIRLPLTVNGIGLVEVSYVYMFTGVGISSADALSFGLLGDILNILVALSGGLVLLCDMVRTAYARVAGRRRDSDTHTTPEKLP